MTLADTKPRLSAEYSPWHIQGTPTATLTWNLPEIASSAGGVCAPAGDTVETIDNHKVSKHGKRISGLPEQGSCLRELSLEREISHLKVQIADRAEAAMHPGRTRREPWPEKTGATSRSPR